MNNLLDCWIAGFWIIEVHRFNHPAFLNSINPIGGVEKSWLLIFCCLLRRFCLILIIRETGKTSRKEVIVMILPDFHIEEHEMTLDEVKAVLDGFEREYGMTSEEFFAKWKKGEAYWVADSVAWSGFFKAYRSVNGVNGKNANQING
jgi:hypothetical protein